MNLNDTLLDLQEARIQRAKALQAESDAARAKADEAKARLAMLKRFGGQPTYPHTALNLMAEWEHWTVEARRKHDEAYAVALSGTV